jgi:hypothetical protein
MQERRTDWARRVRFEEVRREVAERLAGVVPALPTAEVDALLRRMTLIQIKYEIADHPRAH